MKDNLLSILLFFSVLSCSGHCRQDGIDVVAEGSAIPVHTVQYTRSMNPFEPMDLAVIGNYAEIGYNNGDNITTTAFMAMLLVNKFSETNNDRALREFFNNLAIAGGIIAAPATGGGSLTAIAADISVVAAGVALTDNMLQEIKTTSSVEEYAANKEFYDAWNNIHTATMAADGVAGGAVLGKNIVGGIAKIGSWDNFIAIAKRNAGALKGEFAEAWSTIRGLKGANVLELTLNGKLFGKFIRGKSLEIIDDISLYGGNKIELVYNKTTTVTGVLDDVNTVAKRGINADGSFNGITAAGEANEGGINILRSPEWGKIQLKYRSILDSGDELAYWEKVTDEFWETVNKPWLDEAIARGDNFRFVSDPTSDITIYVTRRNSFILDRTGNKIKSIFGREIEYLQSNGYKVLSNGTVIK